MFPAFARFHPRRAGANNGHPLLKVRDRRTPSATMLLPAEKAELFASMVIVDWTYNILCSVEKYHKKCSSEDGDFPTAGSLAYPRHTAIEAVLRIRDLGSGAFVTPGSGMGKKSRSGSLMNIPDHISESLGTIFCVKNT